MKFPPFVDLDGDQKKIYAGSPREGAILIVGPPGSGKTVVAMHRAFRLGGDGSPVSVIMFNKVLSQYTANFPNLPKNINITHMHDWVKNWYKSAFGRSLPKIDRFDPDWRKISNEIKLCDSDVILNKLHWGHLIIDEGQDFSPEMYSCLRRVVRHPKYKSDNPPTLTVFADENQTITDTNSSILELCEELNTSFDNNRLWRLSKNYRNGKEIAEFARYYQVQGAGAALLPEDENGMKPIIYVYEQFGNEYKQMVNLVVNSGNIEAGIIVFGNKSDVKYTYHKISELVLETKQNIRVQGYVSGRGHPLSDIKNLIFDAPPSITIVHSQSAKGLEFDVVFLLKLDSLVSHDFGEMDSFKRLYVASSRARSLLVGFIRATEETGLPTATRLLPEPIENICDYKCNEPWASKLEGLLSDVDWLPSASLFQRKKVKDEDLIDKILKLGKEKAAKMLHNTAERKFELHVLRTMVDEVIDSESRNDIADLIIELGVGNVKKSLKEDLL